MCHKAERDCQTYQYARVGPLADDTDLKEILSEFRGLDGREVVEIAWIPLRFLSRASTGRWLHLKVKGTPPTKVAISGVVYWTCPYLLPLLCCPVCQKIGHSINTCRSLVQSVRYSGPHPYK